MDSSTTRVKENITVAENKGADILVITLHYYLYSKAQKEIVRHIECCAKFASNKGQKEQVNRILIQNDFGCG